MPGGGSDEAVEQARVFDLVAPAECFDDALDVASALADVLDEVEVFVAADLLDTDEHGWCPWLTHGHHGESARSQVLRLGF